MTSIQLAYTANLVLLIPIAIPTLIRLFRTDQGRFEESSRCRVPGDDSNQGSRTTPWKVTCEPSSGSSPGSTTSVSNSNAGFVDSIMRHTGGAAYQVRPVDCYLAVLSICSARSLTSA